MSLQQILSSNYKWWYFFKFNMHRVTKFKTNVIGYRVGEVIQALAIILIWQTSTATKSFNEASEIITYFVLGNLILTLTRTYLATTLATLIANGKLVQYQMFPQDIFKIFIVRGFGASLTTNLFALIVSPIFIVPFIPYIKPISANFIGIIILVVMVLLCFWMKYLWDIIVSTMAFFTPEFQGVVFSAEIIWQVLAGALIPFYLLNPGFQFIQYLPPAFTFYHPMQIYLGNYNTGMLIVVLGLSLGWSFGLFVLARYVYKIGLKRNESVGL